MCAVICPTGIVNDKDEKDYLKPMDINEFHKRPHQSEDLMRHTAIRCGFKLKGKLEPCIHCSRAKSKRKKIAKATPDYPDLKKGEMIGIDITGCKKIAMGGYKYVHGKIDYATGKIFPTFCKHKDEVTNDMLTLINTLKKKYNGKIKYIRCDGAGENISLKDFLKMKSQK